MLSGCGMGPRGREVRSGLDLGKLGPAPRPLDSVLSPREGVMENAGATFLAPGRRVVRQARGAEGRWPARANQRNRPLSYEAPRNRRLKVRERSSLHTAGVCPSPPHVMLVMAPIGMFTAASPRSVPGAIPSLIHS